MEFNSSKYKAKVYPELSQEFIKQLDSIGWSNAAACKSVACTAYLNDGSKKNVYVCQAMAYIPVWGIWPEDDKGKTEVLLNDVIKFLPSENALPLELSKKAQSFGKVAMGASGFVVIHPKGNFNIIQGNASGFVNLGPDAKACEALDVTQEGFERRTNFSPIDYSWCLFR